MVFVKQVAAALCHGRVIGVSHFLGLAAAFAAILVLKGIPGSCRAGAYSGYDFMVAPSGHLLASLPLLFLCPGRGVLQTLRSSAS